MALSLLCCLLQNRDYKENPDKFKSSLQEPLEEEGSPKIKRGGGFKMSVRGGGRGQSLTGWWGGKETGREEMGGGGLVALKVPGENFGRRSSFQELVSRRLRDIFEVHQASWPE